MSFNFKGKTIYLSLVSLVTLIITLTFCYLSLNDTESYGETMKNIVLIITGYFFNHEQNQLKRGEKNE